MAMPAILIMELGHKKKYYTVSFFCCCYYDIVIPWWGLISCLKSLIKKNKEIDHNQMICFSE